MDAHINNRETFLTDAQFLNRLSKRVRLRFVVEINGDLAAIETGHEVVFLFSSFFPFPIFSFSFSFALVRAFFFSFFFACSQRVPHSRLLPVRLSTLHEIPGVSSPRRERFHLSRNEFLVIYSFFFFFFLRDRPHNYATLNVEPNRFAFQTDHLPFFRSDFAAHLVARFEGKRVPPLPFDFIEMDSKFLLTLNR